MDRKFTATVRVMRSHDYCHFEATLSTEVPATRAEINEMRKEAALLCDEAVRQYRVMKKREVEAIGNQSERERVTKRLDYIRTLDRDRLTVEDAALLKASEDVAFMESLDAGYYRYDDEEESCLPKGCVAKVIAN